MAIVNRTPDSFYDQGSTSSFEEAWQRVEQAIDERADIIDVGGVKAGAGEPVTEAEEIDRTIGLVAQIRERYPWMVISVDTYRSGPAEALCRAGADLINDTWAGFDPDVAAVAARHRVGLVCSHTGGMTPRTLPHRVRYADVVDDVVTGTIGLAERALSLGVPRESIVIDPTHDFGKNTYHSLELTRRLDEIVATGWPVLVSVSRKDFVGETLNLPVADRLPGTLAATAICAWHGARVFRAHDVAATRQVVDMVASVQGSRQPTAPLRGLA
jgi:dihydropteroate synthase